MIQTRFAKQYLRKGDLKVARKNADITIKVELSSDLNFSEQCQQVSKQLPHKNLLLHSIVSGLGVVGWRAVNVSDVKVCFLRKDLEEKEQAK